MHAPSHSSPAAQHFAAPWPSHLECEFDSACSGRCRHATVHVHRGSVQGSTRGVVVARRHGGIMVGLLAALQLIVRIP
jgi:hypothetical protein